MNEAERLREAMLATERADHDMLDLAAVVREGRRLRRRRRVVGTGSAALVLAVAVAVPVALTSADPERPGRGADPVAGARTATPTTAPTAGPTTAAAPTTTPAATTGSGRATPKPVGTVLYSGIRYGVEERVFYVVGVAVPKVPQVKIGLVAGRRNAAGELTPDVLVNDVAGRDRHAGFHEIGYDQQGDRPVRPPVPTFGYFVGPAAQIVGTVDGRQVPATLARWSEDSRVVIFWFDPKVLTPGVRLDGIVARDKRGERL